MRNFLKFSSFIFVLTKISERKHSNGSHISVLFSSFACIWSAIRDWNEKITNENQYNVIWPENVRFFFSHKILFIFFTIFFFLILFRISFHFCCRSLLNGEKENILFFVYPHFLIILYIHAQYARTNMKIFYIFLSPFCVCSKRSK